MQPCPRVCGQLVDAENRQVCLAVAVLVPGDSPVLPVRRHVIAVALLPVRSCSPRVLIHATGLFTACQSDGSVAACGDMWQLRRRDCRQAVGQGSCGMCVVTGIFDRFLLRFLPTIIFSVISLKISPVSCNIEFFQRIRQSSRCQ